MTHNIELSDETVQTLIAAYEEHIRAGGDESEEEIIETWLDSLAQAFEDKEKEQEEQAESGEDRAFDSLPPSAQKSLAEIITEAGQEADSGTPQEASEIRTDSVAPDLSSMEKADWEEIKETCPLDFYVKKAQDQGDDQLKQVIQVVCAPLNKSMWGSEQMQRAIEKMYAQMGG